MTLHSVRRFEPFEIHYEATDSARAWSPIHVARMRASYGPKSGPKAGSRASSPGEQAAACDYQRKLVSWAGDTRGWIYCAQRSPTVKPSGKGSSASRTYWLMLVIQALPVMVGTTAG